MTEETVKRGPGRPPKAVPTEPVPSKVTVEDMQAALAKEREYAADLIAALKRAHSLFFELRVTAALGYTTQRMVDRFLAETGHLIGRE